jgi:hypothetical protein
VRGRDCGCRQKVSAGDTKPTLCARYGRSPFAMRVSISAMTGRRSATVSMM